MTTYLPGGLEPYKRTNTFTEDSVPAGLLAEHSTKDGVWGLIHVEKGAENLSRVRPKERERLGDEVDEGYRLACQTTPAATSS